MKIYTPQPSKKLIGGPYSFLRNLKHVFDSENFGISFTNNHLNADALFFPVTFSKAWIRYYRKLALPVIQRLDGLHYPQKHGCAFKQMNKPLEHIYKELATHIIFQSKHSQKQFEDLLGASNATLAGNIPNGAREDLFQPNTNHTFNKEHVRFITTGNFRGEDMLQPLLPALDELSKTQKFTLTVIGKLNFDEKTKEEILSKPYIEFKGSTNLEGLAEEFKEQDIFLFSHLNPPCPNSVIEALSAGLPVVSFDSGAMEELCSYQKELLAPTRNKTTFNIIEDLDSQALTPCLHDVINNYIPYKETANKNASTHSMKTCAKAYADAFKSIHNKGRKAPCKIKRLKYFAIAYAEYLLELSIKVFKKVL